MQLARKRLLLFVVAVAVIIPCCILLPCAQTVRDGEGWVRSAHSINNVGSALRTYHDLHGGLPSAVVYDKNGRPLYSWRVLLLRYLAEDELLRKFKLDEPWDSPHNIKLQEETPRCYLPALGGNDAPGLTRYQVLVGPGTAFERDGLTWNDFSDGISNTLLLVEANDPVPWSKPADLTYEPNGPLPAMGEYRRSVHFLCYKVGTRQGFNAVFADGSRRFIRGDSKEQDLRAVITRNGGERVRLSDLGLD